MGRPWSSDRAAPLSGARNRIQRQRASIHHEADPGGETVMICSGGERGGG